MKATLKSSFLLTLIVFQTTGIAQDPFDVLVFSKTNGFRHSSINAGIDAIRDLSNEYNFNVIFTEDSTSFTPENLDTMEVVIFLNTTGNVLGVQEQSAFENFIENGGGFVGIHSATDTEYDWPWYGKLIGSYFAGHPAVQFADATVVDGSHPSTMNLPSAWSREDEWYNFQTPFPDNLNVLITIDENSYSGGTMGDFHPVSWFHEIEKGRSFYTAMGHTDATYSEPSFLDHLAGGIIWASGTINTPLNESILSQEILVYPNPSANIIKIKVPDQFKDLTISVKLASLRGSVIHEKNDPGHLYNLDVSYLDAGTYILEVKLGSEIYRSPIVIP